VPLPILISFNIQRTKILQLINISLESIHFNLKQQKPAIEYGYSNDYFFNEFNLPTLKAAASVSKT
jgi:hypothetical protein